MRQFYVVHFLVWLLAAALAGATVRGLPQPLPAGWHANIVPDQMISFDWNYRGDQLGAEFGYAVSGAGDVNGDGFDDVLVGAPRYEQDTVKGGAAFLFRGAQTGLETSPGWVGGSDLKGSRFGAAVSSAGDVNGDGFDDVLIGAYRYKNGESEEGRVFLFHGSAGGLSNTPNWVFESNQTEAQFGYSVSSAGDVNGDGFDDVLIGARWYSNGQANEGAAFLFHGSAAGLSDTPNWAAEGNQAGAGFGSAASSAGDVNGDGFDDVLIGAPFFDAGGSPDTGSVTLFFGAHGGLESTPGFSATGTTDGAGFGSAVSSAGDVNGDGFDDVLVGAPNYSNGQDGEGRIVIYLGGSAGPADDPWWAVESDQSGAQLGASVHCAGDVNGDGFVDILAGAPDYSHDQSNEGAVFVFRFAPHLSGVWLGQGDKADTALGTSVGFAGDVNSDGYADIIAGAPQYRIETELRGQAVVDYGGNSADITPNFELYLPQILRQLFDGVSQTE